LNQNKIERKNEKRRETKGINISYRSMLTLFSFVCLIFGCFFYSLSFFFLSFFGKDWDRQEKEHKKDDRPAFGNF